MPAVRIIADLWQHGRQIPEKPYFAIEKASNLSCFKSFLNWYQFVEHFCWGVLKKQQVWFLSSVWTSVLNIFGLRMNFLDSENINGLKVQFCLKLWKSATIGVSPEIQIYFYLIVVIFWEFARTRKYIRGLNWIRGLRRAEHGKPNQWVTHSAHMILRECEKHNGEYALRGNRWSIQ